MTDHLAQLGIRAPSPIVPIEGKEIAERGLQVYMKLEQELHPAFGGNKWRKLKYNLIAYLQGDYREIWSFGGPYSNHIHALAAVCQALRIPCHGIIRDSLPPGKGSRTLDQAREHGMQLHLVSRTAYRNKRTVLQELTADREAAVYEIPEGGSNGLALPGVGEIIDEVKGQLPGLPDYWICSAGSGGTAAGLLQALPDDKKLLVFPALKGDWMRETILGQIPDSRDQHKLIIQHDHHFGGFARYNSRLVDFMMDWYDRTSIALDPLYNGKAVFGCMDLIQRNYFPEGSSILILHTGGLQGIPDFNARNALQLPY